MRFTDLLVSVLLENGIEDIFMVSGGGCISLTDGLASNSQINPVCCHHEQAAAMAAVGYAKYKGAPGCVYLTSGCGGTNAVTAALHAWQDNTPCVFITGQVKLSETTRYTEAPVRQLGVQEADIISIVSSITKYAVMLENPEDVLYHVEKAIFLAKSGRPGPVWLDIPMDIQTAEVNLETLRRFNKDLPERNYIKPEPSAEDYSCICRELRQAKRPVVIAGQGIRLSGSQLQFQRFVEEHNIPVVFSRLGMDALPTGHSLNIGAIGNKGSRAGNLAVQNADFVLVLGSRLSPNSTGRGYSQFAREAHVITVDIDPYEHTKNTVLIYRNVVADLHSFLEKLPDMDVNYLTWAERCEEWKNKYPAGHQQYADTDDGGMSAYTFIRKLSEYLKNDSVVVTDTGSACFISSQAMILKRNTQRYITSGAQAEMGFTLPGAVGVSFAQKKGEVIGITGDGSLQMNLQELQTIFHHNLPIKLFILNNNGYLSIKYPQKNNYEGRYIGSGPESGVTMPDLKKIAYAYGIKYLRVEKLSSQGEIIQSAMSFIEPVIIEVMCNPDEELVPIVKSVKRDDGTWYSAPLEDMYPFLTREEFYSAMIIKPLE